MSNSQFYLSAEQEKLAEEWSALRTAPSKARDIEMARTRRDLNDLITELERGFGKFGKPVQQNLLAISRDLYACEATIILLKRSREGGAAISKSQCAMLIAEQRKRLENRPKIDQLLRLVVQLPELNLPRPLVDWANAHADAQTVTRISDIDETEFGKAIARYIWSEDQRDKRRRKPSYMTQDDWETLCQESLASEVLRIRKRLAWRYDQPDYEALLAEEVRKAETFHSSQRKPKSLKTIILEFAIRANYTEHTSVEATYRAVLKICRRWRPSNSTAALSKD